MPSETEAAWFPRASARRCARYAVHMSGELRNFDAQRQRFEEHVIASAGPAAVDLYAYLAVQSSGPAFASSPSGMALQALRATTAL